MTVIIFWLVETLQKLYHFNRDLYLFIYDLNVDRPKSITTKMWHVLVNSLKMIINSVFDWETSTIDTFALLVQASSLILIENWTKNTFKAVKMAKFKSDFSFVAYHVRKKLAGRENFNLLYIFRWVE